MATSKTEQSAYVQLSLLHQADTGLRVALNLAWIRAIYETDTRTVFTFVDGSTEAVEERFEQVVHTISSDLQPRRRTP